MGCLVAVCIVFPFVYAGIFHGFSDRFLSVWWVIGWMLALLMILVASSLLAALIRKREIRSRHQSESSTFVAQLQESVLGIPDEFALATRRALASGYCVPVEFIGASDTRRQTRALSKLSSPLAVEVIAEIDRDQGLNLGQDRILLMASAFKKYRPRNIAELARILHESFGVLESGSSSE